MVAFPIPALVLALAVLLLAAPRAAAQISLAGPAAVESAEKDEQAAPAASGQAAAPPFTVSYQDGFILQSGDGAYRLVLNGLVQMDGRFSLDRPTPFTDTFVVRKARPTLSGRIGRFFDFKLMPDFGNGTSVITDAYFDIRFSPKFRVRAGKDKTPIGYELLIGDAFVPFPERSLASSLVPNRDVGVQAQGDLKGGKLIYAGGVFNGIPDGTSSSTDVDTNNTKDLAGRIMLQPFRTTGGPPTSVSGLGFNLGGSWGRQFGPLPQFRTSAGQSYLSYLPAATAAGIRTRVTPAVFYYFKALGAYGEYMRSTQPVRLNGVSTDVTNQAWNITGIFVVTGEAATDRGLRPIKSFDPTAGHWGGLELLARYSQLAVDHDAFDAGLALATASSKAQAFTVGANWYPNANIKYYATYEHTEFEGERPTENVIIFRAQLAF